MDIGCVKVVYGYWLCEVSVWILVVMRLVYGYWLC